MEALAKAQETHLFVFTFDLAASPSYKVYLRQAVKEMIFSLE